MLSAIILRTVCCARGFVLRLEAKRVQNCYYCIAGFVSSMLFPEEVSLLFVFVLVFFISLHCASGVLICLCIMYIRLFCYTFYCVLCTFIY